ncbi:4a-hydroxytetrahydrobiopterin dehydratase [Gloeobacter violaceus]|uniref:Putative pterin-4-alpha-carbinolamine dehydratase 2 n=1 Tax=Gloeobacter violaceus (strain ATCC 29082 / PCC 7421) TaxID=251221 RepID=PHS2_GLOVI|nr:4a-hydroxytetrahydrobiopterin dehydratase [Gloeobacter violaceus]Q7NK35.1 RecName: Full=Putative pterin-4-alpha-carbinolamine dehydratase 2; Short=PHS 2; AltName: Full=4-alpha-hydroxy-tetrahydropterin dehydratase 2; AltName: Full=Pterin carbinolamine dehydratase 2; Short=PCD 2 [Gloeobacter violaceus PCC 7421]BAC89586.1 pterin-4a-carbinolamine dehydratase [Gloeobacter violaceus PCC 7421]
MNKMTPEEIETALKPIADWQLSEADGATAIERVFRFDDFVQAIAFVNKVAERAETAGHHPDIHIHYNRVRLVLSTHDAGGVTSKDLEMAAAL